MRGFEGFDGRYVIMASGDELKQGYDFVAELGKPNQFGKDGFVLLGVTSSLLTGALKQEGFIWKSSTAENLQGGQFNDKITDAAFIIPHTPFVVLLYFKAVSLDLCYPDLESDLWHFSANSKPHPKNLSPVGQCLRQIFDAFYDIAARDTDKLSFAEAIETLMLCAKWHTAKFRFESQLAAHREEIRRAS
jgi:hypothetical protein